MLNPIGPRIKKRRKILGLSADEVAEAIGVSRATLYRYESENCHKVPMAILSPLARLLKTDAPSLLDSDNAATESQWLEENASPMSKVTYLPIIGVVRAGVGGIAYEDHLGEEFIETDTLKGHSIHDFFWSKVKGDSMEPRLFDGDLVLVRKQTSIDSGSYAVVLVDDEEGVVKRVTYDDNSITLHSQNSKYPPRVFKDREVLRVRIVGKVIKSQSTF